MPFTFSHPAIVLPLAYFPKKWFSITGLVIGSLTPDFEYFLRMTPKSEYSHTIAGIFWFDLPLGIVLTFVFHILVRDSLFDNLPKFLKTRFVKFKQFNWNNHFKKNWIVVLISIIIGVSSHIFWDSFTHDHAYFVERIDYLKKSIELLGFEIPVFKILQHGSTLIGAVVIAYAVYKLPQVSLKNNELNFKYWILFSSLVLLIVLLRFLTGLQFEQYGSVVVTLISASLLSLIVTSLLQKTFRLSSR